MNKRVAILCVAAVALTAIQTSGTATAAVAAVSAAKPVQPSQQQTATEPLGTVVVDVAQLQKLNHETAIPLVLGAQSRFVYAMQGGTQPGKAFLWSGKEYRYLSTDIDTKAKLTAYLMQTYTKQASEQFIGKNFVEVEGKLAQLNADSGNLLQFNKATAKMITMTPAKRSYLLTVPYPAEAKQANAKIPVNFEKVGSYWKISTAPHVIFG